MRTATLTKAIFKAQQAVQAQEAWIQRCGGNLTGYLKALVQSGLVRHSGDGAEAIYAADIQELNTLVQRLHELVRKEASK